MSRGKYIGSATFIALAATALPAGAIAKDRWDHDRDRRHHHHDSWEDWDNRRDARRAGIIAGTAAAGVAGAAANSRAREDYEDCMRYYAYNRRYETYCREEYYYDRLKAERAARRTGVVVGLTVREIVRD